MQQGYTTAGDGIPVSPLLLGYHDVHGSSRQHAILYPHATLTLRPRFSLNHRTV